MEEEKIYEAEVENAETEIEKPANTKKDFYIEMVLILILGILMGIAIKTEAAKRITVGFDDFRIQRSGADFDINHLQAVLAQKNLEDDAQTSDNQEQAASAGTCSAINN